MASRDIKDLDPALQVLAQQFLDNCTAAGLKVFIDCTYRSNDEQNTDYQQGRTTPGKIITDEPAGHSAHNCVDGQGQAAARGFDFALYGDDGTTLDWDATDQRWQTAISIGESLGLISGSCWHMKDNPHLELNNWRSVA